MTHPNTTPGTLGRVRTPKAAIIRRLATIGALALTVLGLNVAVAAAGTHEVIKTKRGSVSFNDLGETLTAADHYKDGYAIRASLTWGGRIVTVTDNTGVKPPNYRFKNLSIPEGTPVKLQMCYLDEGRVVQCSDSLGATA